LNYHPTGSPYAVGIAVVVPYGLTSQWPTDFPGRFSATKASLRTFYVPLNVAWQINDKWSIGGGPVYGHSSVELVQAVDLAQQLLPTGQTFAQVGIATGTQFATAHLNGSASAWGVQLGVSGHPTPDWTIGARFLSPLEFKYDNATASFDQVNTGLIVGGDLPGPTPQTTVKAGTPIDVLVAPQFQTGGALVTQPASTKITHPAQIQAGAAYSGFRRWLIEADYEFVGWKRFDVLPITFNNPALSRALIEQYNNTSSIRLGAEYTVANDGWRLRAGFVGTASAAPPETVTPLLPEQDRSYVMFGAGVPLGKLLTVDASYSHIATPGSRGRIVERTSTAATAAQLNSGVYELSANVVSITAKLNF
jgi:long-chain fatty acid transport protein